MAPTKADVSFPYAYDATSAASMARSTVRWTDFYAFGTCDSGRHEVYITLHNGKQSYEAKTVCSNAPMWIAWFSSVADDVGYVLEVYDGPPNPKKPNKLLARQEGIKVAHAKADTVGRGPLITYPQASDSPVSKNFPCWGTSGSPVYPVSGTFTIGNQSYQGDVMQQATSQMPGWYMNFSAGAGAGTLKVMDSNGDSQSVNLTTQ